MVKFEMLDSNDSGTVIKVIGVGGAGGNAVARMMQSNISGMDFICVNTDAQALAQTAVPVQIRLGDRGHGAGGRPEQGRAAADIARGHIRAALQDTHMAFVIAGMGGGTGTGAAPIVAEVAKELGILTVGVVTKPFAFEGERRMAVAEQGIAEMSQHVHSLIVLSNEKLLELFSQEAPAMECFGIADAVLGKICGGIADIINVPGLLNVDFEDVKTILSEPGDVMTATAVATGAGRALAAAEQALASPWLQDGDWLSARGILVKISGSKASLTMRDIRDVMNTINRRATQDAHIIVGTVFEESLGDQLRVTLLATGLNDAVDEGAPEAAPHDAAPGDAA